MSLVVVVVVVMMESGPLGFKACRMGVSGLEDLGLSAWALTFAVCCKESAPHVAFFHEAPPQRPVWTIIWGFPRRGGDNIDSNMVMIDGDPPHEEPETKPNAAGTSNPPQTTWLAQKQDYCL